ncbi:MAG: septation protein A [Rhizobiaceae bacterium]|nr:septation protein A [Rhizobiaceae bacterium]
MSDTQISEKPPINPVLKMSLELGPLVVFFFANSRGEWLAERFPALAELGGPIFIATALFMAATSISLAVSWVLTRTIPIMPLITGVIVLIFGALTLWLQDETFIKMKPTIVNTLFGSTLLIGHLFGKSFLRYAFDAAFNLDDEGWKKLTIRWGIFFFFLAAINEIVWRNFSTDFWVAFKVWGVMPISMIFMVFQMRVVMQHSLDNDTDDVKA